MALLIVVVRHFVFFLQLVCELNIPYKRVRKYSLTK